MKKLLLTFCLIVSATTSWAQSWHPFPSTRVAREIVRDAVALYNEFFEVVYDIVDAVCDVDECRHAPGPTEGSTPSVRAEIEGKNSVDGTPYDRQLIKRYNDLVQERNRLDEEYARLDNWLYEADTYFARIIEECLASSHPSELLVKRAKEAASYQLENFPYKEMMNNYDAQPGPYRIKPFRFNPAYYHHSNPVRLLTKNVSRIEKKMTELEYEIDDFKRIISEEQASVDNYEKLYLKLVNDFLKEGYTNEGLREAQSLVARVSRNEAKANFQTLTDNYYTWLVEIADICAEAREDISTQENKRAWKNPRDSRANIFTARLDKCAYNMRADKSWKIPYFDDLITRAKRRIMEYKDPQQHPMTFDDILPCELSAANRQHVCNRNVYYHHQNGELREIRVR